ncbi:DUF87 domain-containing protein [Psychrobacillus sp. PGGUH221]|uniref:ATP-binding protein n=1 Tax=Psychrobacillus sp. PGGUH221 TaxID=3020058 RepID=UPI0035C696E5
MEIMTLREVRQLQQSLNIASLYLERKHLHSLPKREVLAMPNHIAKITVQQNIRLFQVTKIIYDKNEDVTEKLVNIYNTVGSLDSSLILILDSDGEEVSLYIGIQSKHVLSAQDALEKSFKGNFPGTELKNLRNAQIQEVMDEVLEGKNVKHHRSICSVTGVPALKDIENKGYIQGLEKLIDAMRGEKFSALFLANAIPQNEASTVRHGYEELYSSLVPFKTTDLTAGKNESSALTKGISEGITNTINDSLTKTQSYTDGASSGISDTFNENNGVNMLKGMLTGIFGGKVGSSKGITTNKNTNESITNGSSATEGTSSATSKTANSNNTSTEGISSTMQVHLENKTVSEMLEKIDNQLDRLQSAEDLGLWHYACYFIADDEQTARVAATNYQSLIRGDNSAIEGASINMWNKDHKNNHKISGYLRKFSHPLLNMTDDSTSLPQMTAGTLINGRELAIAYGLPRKSVSGIPVIEMAEFGRNVLQLGVSIEETKIQLGNIYYMGQTEPSKVNLDLKSLAMHTFVTGSTGSGKSNTIYQMLGELNKQNVKFLIIEPAKGEYKNVFGGQSDVIVLGTNPTYAPLLKINPFRFPEEVHVLEHIERLIEIFNACWPMYAAMPAVLKEAVELVYEQVGWDLESSQNFETYPVYPTLKQLVEILPAVINESGYSEEVKSNYIGALVTRVKSLTNGLIGKILTDDEIDNGLLFDSNCIVDLSRIGSTETKSLLMGILFMRLQEHRIAKSSGMNEPLKHITVLEEAHHLLRKTSNGQSDEGANLQGKSVEMITNAIAEMRTYGEGFIIADQSPNLLDTSVIRNTNTKIIMRLPDGQDRSEVGTSASLNEEQLNEIPKLETGVAIVYQNNWLQPVLCKIEHYNKDRTFNYSYDIKKELKSKRGATTLLVKLLLLNESIVKIIPDDETINSCIASLATTNLPTHICTQLVHQLEVLRDKGEFYFWQQEAYDERAQLISLLVNGQKILAYAKVGRNIDQLHQKCERALARYVETTEKSFVMNIIQAILYVAGLSNRADELLYHEWYNNKQEEVANI